MSIVNWFNKPKWKHKDADVRVISVSSDTTEELVSQLANISQNDESEKVRSAALRRLTDYALIAKIAENDSNKSVKATAYKILQDWFAKTNASQQTNIIKSISDNKTIEVAATHSTNRDVRSYCIEKITQQGLLAELLVSEQDKDLRQVIVTKITKPATLKRLAKLLKNKDKNIFKIIQSKLENDGDMGEIIDKKALELCEQMEKLIHSPSTSSKADVEKINDQWQALSKDNSLDKFTQRFQGALRTASLTFDPDLREEFLNQQRQQRIASKIVELKTSLADAKDATWEQLQTQISKYSGFEMTHATTEQANEFEEFLSTLKVLRDAQSQEQDLPENLLAIADKLDAALKHKLNQPNQINDFRKLWDSQAKKAKSNPAFNTLKNRFDNAMLKLAEKIESSAALRDQAAKDAVSGIEIASKLVKDGQLADAKIAINKIAHNKKIAGLHPLINENKFSFDNVWNELKELRQWQTWSNDKIRIRLIEELKALVGTGTHPDALLKKMKESNKRWKDMEDHEKLEGDRYGVRNQEQYAQFRAVQEALFTPAKEFFEKRSEIWGNELEQVEANIKALHGVDLEETSDRDLAALVRDAIKQLRNLDKIPPKNRGKCAAKIRSGTARIDAHLKESYKAAESRKEKLIEQAQQLVEHENLGEAIEQAKALQQEWKNAGVVHQSQERKLWRVFRKTNDAVFNRIKEQRDLETQENKALLEQAKTLIVEVEKSIESEKEAHTIQSIIGKFKDDWRTMRIDNNDLRNRADKLITTSEEKVASLANSEFIDSLKNTQKFATICQDLELGILDVDSAQVKWDKLKPLTDKKLGKKLTQRFSHYENTNEDYIDTASTILIATEYLTGSATPDAYKDKRLAYQVEELSKRMSGEESMPESDKAMSLLNDWFILPGADKAFIKENDKRIKKLIKSLYELLR
jgi:exonuclease SbcC